MFDTTNTSLLVGGVLAAAALAALAMAAIVQSADRTCNHAVSAPTWMSLLPLSTPAGSEPQCLNSYDVIGRIQRVSNCILICFISNKPKNKTRISARHYGILI